MRLSEEKSTQWCLDCVLMFAVWDQKNYKVIWFIVTYKALLILLFLLVKEQLYNCLPVYLFTKQLYIVSHKENVV